MAEEVYEEFFASVRAGLVVEQSHQGQLYRILRMFVDVPPRRAARWPERANPFVPAEVVDRAAGAARARCSATALTDAREPQE